ncbi:MAG: hypothetical protein JNM80_13600 [Phycisphaerae bacterium]|nr:hypothetical protein [Phycisphaerae bacterium]
MKSRARGATAGRTRRAAWLDAGCGALVVVLAGGCVARSASRAPTALRTEDFRAVGPVTMPEATGGERPGADPGETGAVTVGERGVVGSGRPRGADDSSGRDLRVEVVPGAPRLGASDASAMGDVPTATDGPTLINEKVGEINGRPVWANEVFDEIGPTLANAVRVATASAGRDAAQLADARREWLGLVRQVVASKLRRVIEDELLSSEFRAGLKPQEKQGLKAFLDNLVENQRRQAGGRAAAERELREANLTRQELVRERERQLFIYYETERSIRSRARVSWKDVQVYYERNREAYNPTPKAVFRVIRVSADKAEEVAAALATGRPFAEVARSPENMMRRSEGGLLSPIEFEGEYAKADFFDAAMAPLNEAARALTPGAHTPTPVEVGGDRVWLMLERIDAKTRPLSDGSVQLEIIQTLTARAEERERARHVARLARQASLADPNEIAQRLVEMAEERYWPVR